MLTWPQIHTRLLGILQRRQEAWAKDVTWTAGDALEPETYAAALAGARAVIVAVGSPPVPTSDVAWQLKMNGTTNATAVEAAGEAGVSRVVLRGAPTPAGARTLNPTYRRPPRARSRLNPICTPGVPSSDTP